MISTYEYEHSKCFSRLRTFACLVICVQAVAFRSSHAIPAAIQPLDSPHNEGNNKKHKESSSEVSPAVSMTRLTIDDIYATGRHWVSTSETGVKHCAIQGTLSLKAMTMDGRKKGEGSKDKDFLLHLWTRVKSNTTHWKVRMATFGTAYT